MAGVGMYLMPGDSTQLLNRLNGDEELAFIVDGGNRTWQAVRRFETLQPGEQWSAGNVPNAGLDRAGEAPVWLPDHASHEYGEPLDCFY